MPEFSIERTRLNAYRDRFKTANIAVNLAHEALTKTWTKLERAEEAMRQIHVGRTGKNKEALELAQAEVSKAATEAKAAQKRYDEASRVSTYHGQMSSRVQQFVDDADWQKVVATKAKIDADHIERTNAEAAARNYKPDSDPGATAAAGYTVI